MTYEIFTAFFLGALLGLLCRRKDSDKEEQRQIYEERLQKYEQEIVYYKNLCHWHVEQRKKDGQT
jgi:hypothetical protein